MADPADDGRRHKTGRRPWLRLDACAVEEAWDEEAEGHLVTIEGVNLRAAISPPTITVGGRRLRNARFAPDGRSVQGVVDERPEGDRVVVDYGFARAELEG